MKKLQKLSIIACTLAMLLITGCSSDTSKIEAPTINTEHTTINYNDIEYVRPDMDALDQSVADAQALVSQSDKEEELLTAYQAILDEIIAFDTMQSFASIEHQININDEFYTTEDELLENYYTKLDNKMLALTKAILESDYAKAFKEKVGEDFIARYEKNAKLNSPEIEALSEQETALVQEYQKASVAQYTTEYNGEVLTVDDIDFSDPNAAVPYFAIYQQKNKACGEIYLKLVQVRVEIAKTLGYDNYSEYAYDVLGYDFTIDDAKKFEKEVASKLPTIDKGISTKYSQKITAVNESINMKMEDAIPVLQEALKKEFPQRMQDALNYMLDNDMYIFSDDPNMMHGAFSTILSKYGAPFLFVNTADYKDPGTVFHEFGHYSNFFNYFPATWNDGNDLNLAEVHSQGLETLMYNYYPEIYKDNAEIMKYSSISSLVNSVLQGCMEDEFQQAVYANPSMTLDELNKLHASISQKYIGYPIMYEWVDIHHNFETPHYYISYATSAISSLELWATGEEDRSKALEIYDNISKFTVNAHYLEALESVGLSNPFDSSIMDKIITEINTKVLKK